MDGETVAAVGFMLFGIGFFLFIVWHITHNTNVDYDRALNERREFGYRNPPVLAPIRKTRRRK